MFIKLNRANTREICVASKVGKHGITYKGLHEISQRSRPTLPVIIRKMAGEREPNTSHALPRTISPSYHVIAH